MSPSTVKLAINSKSLQPMFARRFCKALTAINLSRHSSSFSARARRIKQAADISLASAAMACNAKQAWSRALIRRSRAIVRRQHLLRHPIRSVAVLKKEFRQSRADALRRLMPGGRGMDFCGLLEEAADYITALKAQVQVMQCIADSLES